MRKNERYERFLSRVSKKRKNLFCLGFWSERSLFFDSSEQTDDKIKRISRVKLKLSSSHEIREKEEERGHKTEKERSRGGFGLSRREKE